MNLKKLLALILALMMVLSSLPMAFAEEVSAPVDEEVLEVEYDLADEGLSVEEDLPAEENLPAEEEEDLPIEEEEDAELVNVSGNYPVKVEFYQYDENVIAKNAATVLFTTTINSGSTLSSSLTQAKQNLTWFAGEGSEGHTFKQWEIQIVEDEGGNSLATAIRNDEPVTEPLKENELADVVFTVTETDDEEDPEPYAAQNEVIAKIYASFTATKFDIDFDVDPEGAIKDPTTNLPTITNVYYGQKKSDLQWPALTPAVGADGYDATTAKFLIGGEEITNDYVFTKAETVTVKVPKFNVAFRFVNSDQYKDYANDESWDKIPETAIVDTVTVENGAALKGKEPDGATLTAPAGKVFKNWKTDDQIYTVQKYLTDGDKVEGLKSSVKVIYYPEWDNITYTVHFDLNGGTGDANTFKDQVINWGATAVDPSVEPTKTNFKFSGWQLDGKNYVWDTPVKADITLTALWTTKEVTLTYEYVDYSKEPHVGPGDQGYKPYTDKGQAGTKMTMYTITPKTGYELAGWSKTKVADEGVYEGVAADMINFDEVISEDMTLYPVYTPKQLKITLDPVVSGAKYVADVNGADTVDSELTTAYNAYFSDTKVTAEGSKDVWLRPLADMPGHNFKGWAYTKGKQTVNVGYYEDTTDGKKWTVSGEPIQDAYTLVAQWDDYFTVGLILNNTNKYYWYKDTEDGGVLPIETPIRYEFHQDDYKTALGANDDMVFLAEADATNPRKPVMPETPEWFYAGFTDDRYFDGWYDDAGNKVDLATYKVTGNVDLKAKWLEYVDVTFNLVEANAEWEGVTNRVDVPVPKGKVLADFASEKKGTEITYPNIDADQYYGDVPAIDTKPTLAGSAFVKWTVTKKGSEELTTAVDYDEYIKKTASKEAGIVDDITLQANWTYKNWNVTLDLNGGTYSDPDKTTFAVRDGATIVLSGKATKADTKLLAWKLQSAEKNAQGEYDYTDVNLNDYTVTRDVTLKAFWVPYVAKAKDAKITAPHEYNPETDPDKENYYQSLAEMNTAISEQKKDFVLLADVALENDFAVTSEAALNLNGHTVDGKNQTGNKAFGGSEVAPLTLSNGIVKNATLKNVKITSGTYENVKLGAGEGEYVAKGISGGRYHFDLTETEFETEKDFEGYVATLKPLLADSYGFVERDGYWAVVHYNTLTVCQDKATYDKVVAGPQNTATPGTYEAFEVFDGDVTNEKKVTKKDTWAEAKGSTFMGWYTEVENASGKKVEQAFTFGGELNKNTAVYAKWAENYTIEYYVNRVMIDGNYLPPVKVLTKTVNDSELIPEPKEQSAKEYALLSEEERERVEAAWDKLEADKEGLVGWRYAWYVDDEEAYGTEDVKFGTDKPLEENANGHVIQIFAAFKPEVTFYSMGGDIVAQYFVEDNSTFAESGYQIPDEPAEDGYTPEGWIYQDGGDGLFNVNALITGWGADVVATYKGTEWKITEAGWNTVCTGASAVPATEVTFGGENILKLYQYPYDDVEGNYRIYWTIEAPRGVTKYTNSPQWVYKRDEQGWNSFNDDADDTDNNQQLAMYCFETVTEASLKELVDAKKTKTITFQIAPKGEEKDASKITTLKVIIDPSNLRLYEEYPYEGEAEPPIFSVNDWKYKFTVTFDMDGSEDIALKPIEVEYGKTMGDILDFDETDNAKVVPGTKTNASIKFVKTSTPAKVYPKDVEKKYFTFSQKFIVEGDDDDFSGEVTYIDKDTVIRDDMTITAEWIPVPVTVNFWVPDGTNPVGTSTTTELGGALNGLVIPDAVANQYGTTAWYPVELKNNTPNPKTKAKTAWDITGKDIVGDVYFNEKDADNKYITVDNEANPTVYTLNLIRGTETGFSVTFQNWYGWKDNDNTDQEWIWGDKKLTIDAQYFDADAEGKVSYSKIVVPEFEVGDSQEFLGWVLVPEGAITDGGLSDNQQVFDFNLFKDETFNRNLVFIPKVKDKNARVILKSAAVEFDGLIHLMFKYEVRRDGYVKMDTEGTKNPVYLTKAAYDALSDDDKAQYRGTSLAYFDEKTAKETYVLFSIDGKEIGRMYFADAERLANNEDDWLHDFRAFSGPVPIVNYTDTVNVKVVGADGNEIETVTGKGEKVEGGYDYSLQTYAENKESSSNAKMAALAKSLEDYGIATRLYAGKTDVKVSDLSSAVTSLNVDDMKVNETVTSGTKPTGVKVSQNVVFESDNTLQVVYTLGSGKYTYTLDGKTVEPEIAGGKATVKVPNIAPDKLDTMYTFTISDGTNTFTVKTSVLGYAKRSAAKGSDNMKNLAKALYNYAKAATAYATQN